MYEEYSKRVNAIYARYTDLIEPFGIDESWLDVTKSTRLFGSGEKIAERIRQEVKKELGITVSIGVSFNKVFAKLGSDYKKPDAVTVIDKNNFKDIVFPLPASDLLFVGKKTGEQLLHFGIETIADLAYSDPVILEKKLGKAGYMLVAYANGEDDSPVIPTALADDAKSISNGYTFRHNIVSIEECKTAIDYLVEEIGNKLRKQRFKCSTVSLTIKDEFLRSLQKQRPLSKATDSDLEISKAAFKILEEVWQGSKQVRMLTVSVSSLSKREEVKKSESFFVGEQEDLLTPEITKKEKTLDKIRQKYGNASIVKASILDSDLGIGSKNTKK
jgi:DNA polymerase-4